MPIGKYAAVIVETRDLIGLCPVIDNHLKFIPQDWELVVFGSALNEQSLAKNYPKANFFDISCTNLTEQKYNEVLASADFWQFLAEYDRVLIFQHDSLLLREGIENFIDWDYIGAPWGHFNLLGGNGGLSIRNPKKMLEIINRYKYSPVLHGNEDVYFCKHLPLVNGKIAPRDIAMQFSVETIFFSKPIGIHAADKHLKKSEYEFILKQAV
ncbi:MAG: DUF5672 family protein [Bacteroidota bacterium]